MTDTELYIMRHLQYAHLSDAEAAARIASDLNFQYDSVRGRLSRARHDTKARAALVKVLAQNAPNIPLSVKRQLDVMAKSQAEFEMWSDTDADRRGMFVSDLHAPYTRFDAYELTLQIMEWFKPHAVTALNDGLDNKGYGQHEDNDAVYQQLWRGDFANARKLQSTMHSDFQSLMTDNGKLLGLMGNHDRWLFDFWRKNDPQTAEAKIADYMESLYVEDGVLQFSRGLLENTIHLSDGLVWVHGISSSKNAMSRARNALAYYFNDGRAKSVVQGHLHDAFQIQGSQVGYRGVTFTQNGMQRNADPEWLHKNMPDWKLSVTLCEYNPARWEHDVHLITFEPKRDKLVAQFRGLEWTVNLDYSQPL